VNRTMAGTSTSGYLTADSLNIQNHICVLPCGSLSGSDKRIWSTNDLMPYTSYLINGKSIDRMFQSFIFSGIGTRDGRYIYPLYAGFGEPANINDWIQWIDLLFTPDHNLYALHRNADRNKFDIWISIPYPSSLQTPFGNLNGKALNFQYEDDRYIAIQWWITSFLTRWENAKELHAKLNLRGFLWQRETIDEYDDNLVKRVNQFIKTNQYMSIWLPNYGSNGVLNWRSFGFDVIAINPNYYGNTSFDYKWIDHASYFAKFFRTGLQITFGKGLIYNDTHLLDYMNLGAPDKNNYMKESLLVYQFPNQSLREIYDQRIVDYIRLYMFIKGLYTKISYPNIPY
jgi:hypothetical protein